MVAPLRSRRRILIALVVAVVIGGVGGFAVALVRPVTYTATGTVFVTTPLSSAAPAPQPTLAQQVRSSYVGVASTPIVLQSVIDRLHLDTTVAALAKQVQASNPQDTALIQIEVTDPSAGRAETIENAVQDRLVEVASSLTPTTAGSGPASPLASVQRASSAPSGPSVLVLGLSGALAGVLVWALILAVVQIRRRPPGAPGQPAPSML